MLLEALIGGAQSFAMGVSIYDGIGKIRGAVTGNTLQKNFDRINEKIDHLVDERLATIAVREVEHHEGVQAETVDVTSLLKAKMLGVQKDLGVGLIQSEAIEAPEALMRVFGENPERLLSHVRKLDDAIYDPAITSDPTMVPVVFQKWGVHFIGWTKEGVLSLSLNTDYRARVATELESGVTVHNSISDTMGSWHSFQPLDEVARSAIVGEKTLTDVFKRAHVKSLKTTCKSDPVSQIGSWGQAYFETRASTSSTIQNDSSFGSSDILGSSGIKSRGLTESMLNTVGHQKLEPTKSSFDWRKFVRATNFPESEEDIETLDALYDVLIDPEVASLLKRAEDTLASLADIDLYMEDFTPRLVPVPVWKSHLNRTAAKAMEGLDAPVEQSRIRAKFHSDSEFEKLSTKFMDSYEKMGRRLLNEAQDDKLIVDLSNTRTGRAYLMIGEATGRFST